MYPCTYVCTYIPTMLTSLHDDLMLHFVINLASPYFVAPNKRKHTLSSNWESLKRHRELRVNSRDHKPSVVIIDECSSAP